MRKFLRLSVMPVIVGCIAATLIFTDSLIAPLFIAGAGFAWMAFISWTVFALVSPVERIKALPGYLIGFLAANSILFLGAVFREVIQVNVINIALGSLLAVFIVNITIMYFEHAKKIFLDSMPGIFVGIALTFSGAGVGFEAGDPRLLALIFIYGILGHLCAITMNYFSGRVKQWQSMCNDKTPTAHNKGQDG
ncbi:MAG: hypothetical protein FWE26_01115 [Coriobacteriia bacterium]|nr:hypothetical protein [Coriobacteriia bacterium]